MRAAVLLVAAGMSAGLALAAERPAYPPVVEGRVLDFPSDHGSHPDFRTEWWYATGWLETAAGEELGFQVTFFRTRPDLPGGNPSAFAPGQLVIGHAALSDPRRGRLWHDQRIARASHGLAGAATGDTRVWLDGWQLERGADGYRARVTGEGFAFHLSLVPTQEPLRHGAAGYSRKGPDPLQASYYYSQPQLAVTGEVTLEGSTSKVTGAGWLDHEWSTQILDREATGWDWIGINLADGGALMAFRVRDRDGGSHWAGGSWRRPDGTLTTFGPEEVVFTPLRSWRSPRTGITYPVAFRVRAGPVELELEPLFEDQESDSRLTTGAVYWEGAVRARAQGGIVGRGYLELTGYGEALRLPGDATP